MLLAKALLTTSYSNTLLKYPLSLNYNYICSNLKVSSILCEVKFKAAAIPQITKIKKSYLDILLLEPMS